MGRSDDRVEGSLVGISAGLRRPTLDVQRMVAGREMAVPVIHERRLQRPADLGRVPAPGMEAAGCRRCDRAGWIAAKRDTMACSLTGVDDGHRREERLRVRVDGPRLELVRRRQLHDLAEVHHGDPVGDVADDGEVVGDEEVRQPELALEVLSRLRICAWIETSSAETGSSATISRGVVIERAAIPMRCRWPPENSCG